MTQIERTDPGLNPPPPGKFELTIPKAVPGSEAPLVTLPADRAEKAAAVARLFPTLPPLPEEPVAQPGPDGRPYTLADFQRLAAENNPGLRQAASDVEAARGLMIQAGLYPNPHIGYGNNPDNNNTGSGVQGFFVEQLIKTGGKLSIAVAGARMAMIVAELALKQTRYALATTIRGDFYTLLGRQGNGPRQPRPRPLHRRNFPAASRPAGGRVRRQPRADGLAVPGLHRSPGLQASHCQLHLCLETAGRGHGPAAVALKHRRRAGRSAHPILRLRRGPGSRPPQSYEHPHCPR